MARAWRPGAFPYRGSNWFVRPSGAVSEKAWKQDLALLRDEHRRLVEAVSRLRDKDLYRRLGRFSIVGLVRGISAHDLYHAGQIQLLKRLQR